MRKCPNCDHIYDDSHSFCLNDGTSLVVEMTTGSQETMILPRKKNKFPLILGGFLVLVGATLAGWMLIGSSADKGAQNSPPKVVSIQTPSPPPALTPTETPTPIPSPSLSPTVLPQTNSSVSTNSEVVSNVKPSDESNSAKQLPPIMKTEDHSVVFGLLQCRKSGSSITCDFLLTNKGTDRRFQFVIYKSNLYDELGNGYDGKNGQLANQEGSSPRIAFVSGVTAKAQISFEGIEPNASKITLLRLQYDVGDDNNLEVKFRNVPLIVSK